jgi:hypothetical protein
MCRNKLKGLIQCSYIYPVKVNVEWVDLTNCLMCFAKRDMLETRMKKTKEREGKEKQERGEEEEESDDALIRKQLIDDENHQMEAEKRERVEEWLQGIFESRRGVGGSQR